ncbi:hypothetical protein VE01_08525 [Pseudogymnoascus verrucosus]|uniref:Uncharacterized protein n=1 Tax=Pseudogymnoascus verrucosus TaxID=342668 RepID=A0A1B8GDE0_9PEZI|nr:uncharacterized protein VE01_08525 [Pseudogymnoascus verrucosus]OBT93854.1 hypothetical protein VE01_08525 [Pseudogymnoascus verrucosus]
MVLFKRKPVQYVTTPTITDDDTEVWVIPQTGEVFTEYEIYLNRMDFYKQRRFICQITGHSGLNFFEALKSELAGAEEVEQAFPIALKGPILRRVQFQTISRIDNLVDLIYDEFKKDYYPGEVVMVHVVSGERLTGVVRDKTRFGNKVLPNGTVSPAFSRYFVSLDNRPFEEAVVDDDHITRDRKIFTKQVLRSFIKKTVTREAWTGAPWLVKPDVAETYHIDTRVPQHLKYESHAAERKQKHQQKKNGPDFDGMVGVFPGNNPKLPELKPAPKSHKSKQLQGQLAKSKQPMTLNPTPQMPAQQLHRALPQHQFQAHGFYPNGNGTPPTNGQYTNFHNSTFSFPPMQQLPIQPPPPPPIKYPIEDLQIAPRKEDILKRPPLKFFSENTPVPVEDHPAKDNGILMESMGPLLETWDTLNVYCEIFKLDSFTFDDFVEAMQITSEDVECELFVEIHCATLKLLADSESDGGKVQIQLPESDSDSEDEDDENDESAIQTPTPEPEPKPKGRATRSSLAKLEAEALKAEAERSPTPEEKKLHLADEMLEDVDWLEKLRKRDFKNGGWEIVVVGLLYQLAKFPRFEKRCEELLQSLAPVDEEPSVETARLRYAGIDINLRIKILQIICMLTMETKAIRGFMEECSEQMTSFRKEKIKWQRDRKIALEELRLLNEERKVLLPANTLPLEEPEAKVNGDTKMTTPEEPEVEEDSTVDTDEDIHLGRSLRRGNDRAAERQRKRELEQERREKAEAAAKMPKQSKQFTKLLKDIQKKQDTIKQCEEEIAVIDNDLREADCPRTRCLGKDRFWNRYYWFERNGMPYAGLPNSSTADAGYANGCLWVQGPDPLEREGYIDMPAAWQAEYRKQFDVSVPERKRAEEGATSVFDAKEWAYYDDAESVDGLLAWLDPRGVNELKLQKEIKLFEDKIKAHMIARREYLAPVPAASEEPSQDEGRKRVSARQTKVLQQARETYRCLAWRNGMAVEELGHLHSEQPRVRRPTKKGAVVEGGEGKGKKERGGRRDR